MIRSPGLGGDESCYKTNIIYSGASCLERYYILISVYVKYVPLNGVVLYILFHYYILVKGTEVS